MSEKREYTAEDIDALWRALDYCVRLPNPEGIVIAKEQMPMILAALSSFANVMRPGLIEATLCDANNWPRMSDSIRKALLGEAETVTR